MWKRGVSKIVKPSVTERELLFLWHLAFIGITFIRKCHRKKAFPFVTLLFHGHFLYHLLGIHRDGFCKTCSSTFLVQLFERICCLDMTPHFTIKQWLHWKQNAKLNKIQKRENFTAGHQKKTLSLTQNMVC